MEAKLYLTAFRLTTDPPEEVKIIDTIEHNGRFLMVLTWFDYPDGVSEPETLADLSPLKHKRVRFEDFGYHFECLEPMPAALLSGAAQGTVRANEAEPLDIQIRNRKTYRHTP